MAVAYGALALALSSTVMQVDNAAKQNNMADHAKKVQKEQQDKLTQDAKDMARLEEQQAADEAQKRAMKRAGGGYSENKSRGGTLLTSPLGVTQASPTAGGATLLGG